MLAGVSERTIRRWASSGQVRTVVTGHGRHVVADSLPTRPAMSGQGPDDDDHHPDAGPDTVDESGHLAELVRTLSDRLTEQAAVIGMWQERCRVLTEQLALASPVAPQEPEDGTLAASTATRAPETSGQPWRPWMRSWAVYGAVGLLIMLVLLVAVPVWEVVLR